MGTLEVRATANRRSLTPRGDGGLITGHTMRTYFAPGLRTVQACERCASTEPRRVGVSVAGRAPRSSAISFTGGPLAMTGSPESTRLWLARSAHRRAPIIRTSYVNARAFSARSTSAESRWHGRCGSIRRRVPFRSRIPRVPRDALHVRDGFFRRRCSTASSVDPESDHARRRTSLLGRRPLALRRAAVYRNENDVAARRLTTRLFIAIFIYLSAHRELIAQWLRLR